MSPVGNNDVPYPYAIDTDGSYYLLLEEVIVQYVPESENAAPYTWFYNIGLMTADIGMVPPQQPVIKNFKGIKEYYIGNDRYTLRYTPKAATEYNRLVPNPCGFQLCDLALGNGLLLRAVVENCRSILGTHIRPLTVQCRRVMNGEKDL